MVAAGMLNRSMKMELPFTVRWILSPFDQEYPSDRGRLAR
jgi:hypothetical protein